MNPTFFTDRDLGKRFPTILRASGLTVERHANHFAANAPDEQWLELAGRSGWTAITHDARIRYKPNELEAVVRHGVPLLVVVGKAPFPDLAENFVATLPSILTFLSDHAPPFIGKVYRPAPSDLAKNRAARGSVALWFPK